MTGSVLRLRLGAACSRDQYSRLSPVAKQISDSSRFGRERVASSQTPKTTWCEPGFSSSEAPGFDYDPSLHGGVRQARKVCLESISGYQDRVPARL